MEPADAQKEKKVKIATLEQELADLRQGLCLVQDYYHDLERAAKKQDAEEDVDRGLVRPLLSEDEEFEGIWKFHAEMVIRDPASTVPEPRMYESFVSYCGRKGRSAADRESFGFALVQMGLRQAPADAAWLGCRLRSERR